MLDSTDMAILECLKSNSRMQWKEIGERVHLTGQATANRIARLEELGIIEAYTLKVNESKLGRPVVGFVTIFMKSTDHSGLKEWALKQKAVEEIHRVSGEGCYWMKVRAASTDELNALLDHIVRFGNYRVNLSIGQVK
ncbi:Lrp/AsnC family transcriptional regulator [Paenibacillus thermotolerans]|uniref:Lrp/AsnC family transcriptional regulator n=1 Tax=Paenibacillus thermotolerans TaxID=3027807 RepID=UPI002367F659|nr:MULTISPECIES: Lrp/AsnC family transcriptional regulator [unclassified Paenibacillus]